MIRDPGQLPGTIALPRLDRPGGVRYAVNARNGRYTRRRRVLGALVDLQPGRCRRRRPGPLRSAIRQALFRVNRRLRVALELRFLRGLTNRQIAETLGITVGEARSRVAQGQELLQRQFERHWGDGR